MEQYVVEHERDLDSVLQTEEPTGAISLKVEIENYSHFNLQFKAHHPWTSKCRPQNVGLQVAQRNVSATSKNELIIDSKESNPSHVWGICGSYSWQIMETNGEPYGEGRLLVLTYMIPNRSA